MYVLKMQKHQHQIGQAWKKKFIYLWDNGTDIHIGKSSYLFNHVIFNLVEFFLLNCVFIVEFRYAAVFPLLSSFLLISSLFFSYPISSYHAPGRLLNSASFSFPISSLFLFSPCLIFSSSFLFYLFSSSCI